MTGMMIFALQIDITFCLDDMLINLLSGFLQTMLGCASVKEEDLIKRTDMLLLNRCSSHLSPFKLFMC